MEVINKDPKADPIPAAAKAKVGAAESPSQAIISAHLCGRLSRPSMATSEQLASTFALAASPSSLPVHQTGIAHFPSLPQFRFLAQRTDMPCIAALPINKQNFANAGLTDSFASLCAA